MKQLVVTLIIAVIWDFTNGQYPDCVSCPDGKCCNPAFYVYYTHHTQSMGKYIVVSL